MTFVIDKNLLYNSIIISELTLSTVLLKNNSSYTWLILVPRVKSISEIFQLNKNDQVLLINEISHVSKVIQRCFNPDKINVGALGNIVKQLHVHIVGRNQNDNLWPYSIWQPGQGTIKYTDDVISKIVPIFAKELTI